MDNPYTLKTTFTVYEASAAIHGITRLHRDDTSLLQSTFNELVHAVKTKDLSANVPQKATGWRDGQAIGFRPDYSSATIARDDLLAWCESREIRPALLFPDLPTEKPLHDRERQTLLATIRALAELHSIKSASGAYRKEAESLLSALAGNGIQEPCNAKTLSNHLKEAFSAR
ncbi:MAG: hypothetical protein RKO25_03220 [Candidatus Contendobacter sp.]|nr:hypothetical protein [Candidatus Contendobacter sp.]